MPALKKPTQDDVKLGENALSRTEEELIAIILQGYDIERTSGGAARATLNVLNRKKLGESLRALAEVVDVSSRRASRAAWALVIASGSLVLVTVFFVIATFMAAL